MRELLEGLWAATIDETVADDLNRPQSDHLTIFKEFIMHKTTAVLLAIGMLFSSGFVASRR